MQSLLTHPSLMDCRRMFLRNYEVSINIGVHDFEKRGEQRVLINVELYVPLAQTTPKADQLREVLDYADGAIVGSALVAALADGGVPGVARAAADLARGTALQ